MRWDDAGAPQRSPANAAAIVDILKKCLVEGYGTTDPLGWTLEYEDAPGAVAVFRNSPLDGGSGGYFRISPYSTPTAAYIRTQSAMSAIGVDSEDLFNPGYLNSIPTDASLTNWILVGDQHSFYLILHDPARNYQGSFYEVVIFFGDMIPAVPTDVCKFITTGANSGSTSASITVNSTSSNAGPLSSLTNRFNLISSTAGSGDIVRNRIAFAASVSGAIDIKDYFIFCPGETNSLSTAFTVDGYPTGGMMQPVLLKLNSNLTNANLSDIDNPYIRGRLPGLLCPGYPSDSDATWPLVAEINGLDHLGIASVSSSTSYGGVTLWLNVEDWG
jgi:hypothetical protein